LTYLELLIQLFSVFNYHRYTFIGFNIAILTFLLTSCGDSKIVQCQKIAQISQKISQQAQASQDTQDPNRIGDIAQKFTDAAKQLDELSINDAQLYTYKNDLSDVYKSYSKSTFLIIDAIKNKNIKTARLAKEEVTQTSKKEQTLGQEISKYCQKSG
jgi:hypothetical protein